MFPDEVAAAVPHHQHLYHAQPGGGSVVMSMDCTRRDIIVARTLPATESSDHDRHGTPPPILDA